MNKRQIEALTALRDVMREYDVEIHSTLTTDAWGVDSKSIISMNLISLVSAKGEIDASDITEILEQETE